VTAALTQIPLFPLPVKPSSSVRYVVEVNECGIFATTRGMDFWIEQILLRPIGQRIDWLFIGPQGGQAQIPCEDKEEAEFARDYMIEHGIHHGHVKVKRIKQEAGQ
jgi:hypothetical protein